MEIFGGFMVMMSILSLFMAVVWLVMPFVVFTIKGKLDRTLDVLGAVEKRLTDIEAKLQDFAPATPSTETPPNNPATGQAEPPRDPSLPLA
ncbi:MAG TPA: hypothetical protein VGJ93_05235 [Desulfuromonadaceae bacterium]|jgi:hypothetical protein